MKSNCSRSLTLGAGFIIMLCYGLLYAWSIYSSPLSEEFGWTSALLGTCFTVILIAFCIGGVLGSILVRRLGSRRSVLIGSAMSLLGYALASAVTTGSIWLLFTAFSIAGLACGVVYNATVSTVVMRFADKKGFASGILLMSFGASTLVLGSLASSLMSAESLGWRKVYLATGVILLLVGVLGSRFIVSDASDGAASAKTSCKVNLTPGQMLKSASFWLYFCAAAILTLFGQGIIGHAKSIALEGGASASLASLAVGLGSVANGVGRIVFGILHDRKGYRFALTLDAFILIAAGAILAVFLGKKVPAILVAAIMMCGLGYGAVPPISSSVTQEFFGSEYYAQNFSFTNLNIILASFGSTIMGSMQTASGSYVSGIVVLAALEIVPIILLAILSKIREKEII
jgi:MFS transporter, OFA family, oxalate/formate antiporter